MSDPLEQIKEYYHPADDIYSSGQITPDQIELLSKLKFEVVINLATRHSPDAIPNEQELVMENGMAYVHIPVEWENPTREDLSRFFHFFGPYHSFKTYVHCAKNMRVSAFLFLFRTLKENADPSDCLLDLLTIWTPNEVWQKFIDDMLVAFSPAENPPAWKVNWKTHSIVLGSIH